MTYLKFSDDRPRESVDAIVSDGPRLEGLMDRMSMISSTSDPAQACVVLGDCARILGVQSAAYATFLEEDPWRQSYRFILACHPAWCAEYQRLAWFADDPWLIYARTNAVPARSRDISVRPGNQQAIVDLAHQFDVASALIVPVPAAGPLSRLGVLMLGSADPGFFDGPGYSKFKMHARNLAHEMHDWYVAFLKAQLLSASKLSEQDIELLKHERAGLSTKEIARSTGLQSAAINWRFQRIISRLGVPSRRAAARIAAEYAVI